MFEPDGSHSMVGGRLNPASPPPASRGPVIPCRASKDEPHHPVPKKSNSRGPPIKEVTTSSANASVEDKTNNLHQYIALGCLHFDEALALHQSYDHTIESVDWVELLFDHLPEEVKLMIGEVAIRLLEASWIRMYAQQQSSNSFHPESIVRVYLLPEDWGRRFIDRRSKSLRSALRQLLTQVDISPQVWNGDRAEGQIVYFDSCASAQHYSLFYLFNKLPSPAPVPDRIKDRYSRNAAWGLLDSYKASSSGNPEDAHVPGLRTRLYPYQARTAAFMLEREAAPRLQLDPRLEIRKSPRGEEFFFGARDGSFLQQPIYYETNRGGILAETMGLGKTIISLALILATKGHLPRIPAEYQPQPPTRVRVGSLADMAASTIGRNAIPGKVYLDQVEASESIHLESCRQSLRTNLPCYEIPVEVPRMNRTTKVPPPRQLLPTAGTIIVVPRNLLHQWQSEIRKHVFKDNLKILVMEAVTKRTVKVKTAATDGPTIDMRNKLPLPSELMTYDIVLFSRNRFEQEIQDGTDNSVRHNVARGHPDRECSSPYIGLSKIRDCDCLSWDGVYDSPLRKLHWLRIIIDEGHSFSSGTSNAVLVAKRLQVERRWVVSGTPAKNLVGVEMDLNALSQSDLDASLVRHSVIEQRKTFTGDEEDTRAAKALGLLAANFLGVRPWSESSTEGKLEWDDYIYRHESLHRKTYSSFSTCFLNALEGLVVKTRPDDVEKDIQLPPMVHRTVYLKPSWFDKMIANLFIQVLRANAITSERSDVDYLFHKNSVQAKHSLIRNLRQSMFTWTGFSRDDVISTLETTQKYLNKDNKKCSTQDMALLTESSAIVAQLLDSDAWSALSKSHEVGIAVEAWPEDSEEFFSLAYPNKPAMVGITQLLEGQAHVDRQILSDGPEDGLRTLGQVINAQMVAMEQAELTMKQEKETVSADRETKKLGVPLSCMGGQPKTSRRISGAVPLPTSPQKPRSVDTQAHARDISARLTSSGSSKMSVVNAGDNSSAKESITVAAATPARPKKRKLTFDDEVAELPKDSALRKTKVIGTISAKLTYLIDMIMKHQANEKILVFYDGDNAAYYIAQCLELLYINHRIYARQLDNVLRAQYVALFNEDPSIRVLLIDVACGALGLNLNAASVVLIVNPINRPGIEAQAIKRAHRIGQTKEVLVETLILEGTIEEKIFKRAQNMSRTEHMEAKELEDDNGVVDIIQNAEVMQINDEESVGSSQFALLETPLEVFGRPGRDKYHKFGQHDAKSPGAAAKKPVKRVRTMAIAPKRASKKGPKD